MARELLTCELHRRGWGRVDTFTLYADPTAGAELGAALRDAVRRYHHSADVAEFTLRVRPSGGREFDVVST